ncbi:hypothetical protein BBK36DRAFT_1180670, partial [Trichoderma citrinoviride]
HARQRWAAATGGISASDHCRHAASSRKLKRLSITWEPATPSNWLSTPPRFLENRPNQKPGLKHRTMMPFRRVHRRAAALTGARWSFATLRPGCGWRSAHCAPQNLSRIFIPSSPRREASQLKSPAPVWRAIRLAARSSSLGPSLLDGIPRRWRSLSASTG